MAGNSMEFGVWLLNIGEKAVANPSAFERVATTAEQLGYDALCVGDHVAIPADIPAKYPFSKSGKSPIAHTDENYQSFQTLAYVAGLTDTIKLTTNICVVPYYHPVNLVKHVLTLDALSDGRFEFGAGTGWLETEFDVIDVPYSERGARTDEFLDLLEQACATGELAYDGEFVSFETTGFSPVPADGTTPHLWIGGGSGATIRRIGEYGDGWTTLWSNPSDVVEMRDRIMNAWTDYDRDGTPDIAVVRPTRVGAGDSERLLMGSPDSIIEDIEAYKDAGVTRLFLTPPEPDIDTQLAEIERFATEVLPSF